MASWRGQGQIFTFLYNSQNKRQLFREQHLIKFSSKRDGLFCLYGMSEILYKI
jgi:hypothetical protein